MRVGMCDRKNDVTCSGKRKSWRFECWICHPAADSWGHTPTSVSSPVGRHGHSVRPTRWLCGSDSEGTSAHGPGRGTEWPLDRRDAHDCRCPPRPLIRRTGATSPPMDRVCRSKRGRETQKARSALILSRTVAPLPNFLCAPLVLRLLTGATQNQNKRETKGPNDTRREAPGGAQLSLREHARVPQQGGRTRDASHWEPPGKLSSRNSAPAVGVCEPGA